MLELVAIKYNGLAPVLPIVRHLPPEGGTVGRDDENAVVLPDPMRVVSRRHLEITRLKDGTFRVSNVSGSNPAMLNDEPLIPGSSRPLGGGDRLSVGSYLLEVRTVADSAGGNANPQQAGITNTSASGHRSSDSTAAAVVDDNWLDGGDLFGGLTGPVTDSFGADHGSDIEAILSRPSRPRELDPLISGSVDGIELSDLAGDGKGLIRTADDESLARALVQDPYGERPGQPSGELSMDPLQHFGGGGGSGDILDLFGGEGRGAPLQAGTHSINHRMELRTPFTAPVMSEQETLANPAEECCLPSDAAEKLSKAPVTRAEAVVTEPESAPILPDFDIAELLAGTAVSVEAPVPVPVAQVVPEVLLVAQADPMAPLELGSESSGTPAVSATHCKVQTPAAPSGRGGGDDVVASVRDEHSNDTLKLYQALLDGLGIDSLPERDVLDEHFVRLIGSLLRISVEGVVRLMSVRATMKREVRANVTLIAPERNNPLKFSPDANVALLYLLGRTYPGFMEAEDGVREAFSDLYDHQVGVVSGMRSALDHVLKRFDPDTITRNNHSRGLVDSMLSMGRKARLWDAYGQYFQDTREQAVDRFQDFFGAAFVDAYEEATRVASERRMEER